MPYTYTNISAAPTADDNGYVVSVDMKVGAYGLAATVPGYGARHVTLKRTVVDAVDTPGTVVIVGKDLAGQALTESLVPGATGVTVTGTKFFKSIVSITGVAWVIGGTDEDTIIVGWDAVNAVATGGGVFHGIVVNATAAGTIVIADARGTIAIIAASVTEGFYGPYDVEFAGYLTVITGAASDITVLHSPTMSV